MLCHQPDTARGDVATLWQCWHRGYGSPEQCLAGHMPTARSPKGRCWHRTMAAWCPPGAGNGPVPASFLPGSRSFREQAGGKPKRLRAEAAGLGRELAKSFPQGAVLLWGKDNEGRKWRFSPCFLVFKQGSSPFDAKRRCSLLRHDQGFPFSCCLHSCHCSTQWK